MSIKEKESEQRKMAWKGFTPEIVIQSYLLFNYVTTTDIELIGF